MAQVDIVMALYNKASTVRRAINSIQHQTMEDWRLIVVDDGSTDEGPEIVTGIKDNRIELVHQENRGPGAARNAGISRATGEFLSFLDADDEWYPWFLENSLRAARENDIDLVASMYYLWPQGKDMTEFWAKRGVPLGRYNLKGDEDPIWVNKLKAVMLVLNVLMRSELARKYGGFYDKDHCLSGEDTTFFMRLLFGQEFVLIGPAAARYHLEDSILGFYSPRTELTKPYLKDVDAVLKFCPENKRKLMLKVLDYQALLTAHWLARRGEKNKARDLLHDFPGARLYRNWYYYCRYEIIFSRWMPYWVRLKCALGPPVRSFLKSLAGRSEVRPPAPSMSYEK